MQGLGSVPVRRSVYTMLQDLKLPFQTASWNKGFAICSGQELKKWLEEPTAESRLQPVDRDMPLWTPPAKGAAPASAIH